MALPTALLIKGLAGVGAIGGVVGGGLLIKKLFQSKEPNEIIKDLGITNCEFGEGETKKENCSITGEQLTKIKFSDKAGKEVNITENNKTLTLKIEKLTGEDLPSDLLFTFSGSNDVTIGNSSDANKITLKANTSYDFKIKDDTKLEKAWDLTTLGAKVGLNCTGDTATECSIKTEGINVWKSNEDYITNAQISDSNKNMTVAKETSSYKQGLKFTLKEEGEITLSEGKKKKNEGGISQLTKTNMSYEIDIKEVDGTKTWFLVEKSTTSG